MQRPFVEVAAHAFVAVCQVGKWERGWPHDHRPERKMPPHPYLLRMAQHFLIRFVEQGSFDALQPLANPAQFACLQWCRYLERPRGQSDSQRGQLAAANLPL